MIAQTDLEDGQQQPSMVMSMARARRGVADLVAEGMVTVGFAHTAIAAATTAGYAQALCGSTLPAAGLILIHGSAGPLCLTCITEITPRPAKTPPAVPLVASGPVQRRTP